MKFPSSIVLLVALASLLSAEAFRIPFLNRIRRVFSKQSISTVAPPPLEGIIGASCNTKTRSSSPTLLVHSFPSTPAVPEIITAMELMCLTNNVNCAAADPNTGVAMIEALLNSLDEQRDIMVDRMEEIAKVLPALSIRKHPPLGQTLITTIREPPVPLSSNSNGVVATHWDALSHSDFMSVMNQIPEIVSSSQQHQHQHTIVNTLKQERTIAMVRMAVMDLSIEQLFIVTSRVQEVTTPVMDGEGNHDVQSLLDSIHDVLVMEQDQSAADAIMKGKTAAEFDYTI